MKILAIDPSSAKAETSTNGIVLLNNAKLVKYWVVGYSIKDIRSWYENEGRFIKPDIVVIEKYEARDNDLAKDNSVLETIALFQILFPDAILQRNAGYQSDIPNPLLKKLGLWKFDKSHHQDVRAAARLGLFWAMRNDIEEVVQDIGKAVSGYINQT
ncbi:hypothetical protein [Streptococcus thermophilus]|uniref:hypothetical protein n=1 Tax=Streptococcus thermophilus TaxID=1308 RepID=UPI0021823FEA|nr:hypothetical protein [Streptococcus thermophilus]MCS8613768.1 hypothetical protein [Streptococcus thermophilus]